jgi:lipid-binding SYLF domain-containing protein
MRNPSREAGEPDSPTGFPAANARGRFAFHPSVCHSEAMKKLLFNLFALVLVLSAVAADKPQLDNRIRKLTAKFAALQDNPDKRIPAEMLRQAQGIILLDRTKAGFIFAFQGGGGLAMVKYAKSEQWSPAAFLTASEASLGFQVGGQQSFIVILLMSTNATRFLTDGDIDFGGEARGTAGNSSVGAEGNIKSTPSVLIYDDRHGLYGGAALKGGTISPDDNANTAYYGQYAPLKVILFDKKFKPSEVTKELVETIKKAAK